MYLPNEAEVINLIKNYYNAGNKKALCFKGRSGCGKSFTMEQLQKNYGHKKNECNCFYFCGEHQFDDREYYPLFKFISQFYSIYSKFIKESVLELAEDTPIAPNLINHITRNMVYKSNNDIEKLFGFFNNTEKEIVYKLKSIFSKRKGFIIFDNLHFWDKRSLELLYIILKYPETIFNLNNFVVIFILTEDQPIQYKDLVNDILKLSGAIMHEFPTIAQRDFGYSLTLLGAKKMLDQKQIEILYPLVNGHIQLMLEIVDEINNDNLEPLFHNENNNLEYMKYLLETRLKELGASGEQIVSVLEYASILGYTFSIYELEKITHNKSSNLLNIIKKANQLKLINPQSQDEQSFAHEVIWAVFNSRIEEYKEQYYLDLETCIAEIKPSHYLRRARYCLRACNYEKARYLYLLEVLKQERLYGNASSETLREAALVMNAIDKEYYKSMKKAHSFILKKEYNKAIIQLESIENYYNPALLAEKYILYSQIMTKSFKKEDRNKAVEILMPYINTDIIEHEKDVQERVAIRLLSCLSHIAKFDEARTIENRIYSSLGNRVNYDAEAQYTLNILRRRSNMVHGCETAILFLEKAVHYFGPNSYGIPNNIRDYFISLGNQACLLIDNGQFNEGYAATVTALELEKRFSEISFPRRQIIYNNCIIGGFLSKKKSLSECISEMELLINALPPIAEVFTYTSNLSVFYALSGQLNYALDVLEKEALRQNITEDIEGYYKLRYLTNKAIFQYLSGDMYAYQLIEDLPKTIMNLVNSSYYIRHHSDIIQIMKQKVKIDNPYDWLHIVHQKRPFYQNKAWDFFGLGYLLAPVSNWDT